MSDENLDKPVELEVVRESVPTAEGGPGVTPAPPPEPQRVETYQAVVVGQPPDKASGFAIMALVCGIMSYLCCCGLLTGVPALIIGWLENENIKAGRSSEKGKWMALTGMVLGLISLLTACLWLGWYFFTTGMAIVRSAMPF